MIVELPQISWHERSPIYSLDLLAPPTSFHSDADATSCGKRLPPPSSSATSPKSLILATCGSLQEQSALASLVKLETLEPKHDASKHSSKTAAESAGSSTNLDQMAARIHFWHLTRKASQESQDLKQEEAADAASPPSKATGRQFFDVKHLREIGNDRGGFNCVRFSPNGKLMAAANDDSNIYIYSLTFAHCDETKGLDHPSPLLVAQNKILRGHLDGVYDLSWSHDSKLLVSGSTDRSIILWDINKGIYLRMYKAHKNMIQGTAFSPLCYNFASFSLDRTLKIYNNPKSSNYSQNFKSYDIIKPTPIISYRSDSTEENKDSDSTVPSSNASQLGNPASKKNSAIISFLDDSFPSFFRRICYSPCGRFIFAPTATIEYPDLAPLPITVIFSASDLSKPLAYLPSKTPTICIQCAPKLYKLRQSSNSSNKSTSDQDDTDTLLFDMDYAIVFAVASRDCITVYSTQFRAPLAHLSSLHYANINDLRWSPEGDCLAACSSDGYITFVQFEQHLGEFCEEIYDDDLNLQAGVDNSNKSAAKSGRNKQVPGGNTAQNCKTTQTEVSVNM